MNCLFLDIASHNGALACIQDDAVLSLKDVNTRIRDHELISIVEALSKDAGWKYEDLTNIACVVGPGGFTSLRVAVSFANTLIDQLEIESAEIHLSDLYAARAKTAEIHSSTKLTTGESPLQDILWFHSTKRNALFVRGFGEYEKLWSEPIFLSTDEAKEKIPKGSLWVGELLDEQKEALEELNLKGAQLESLETILPSFVKGLTYAKKPLIPWYGR